MAEIQKGNIEEILKEKKPVLVDFYAEWCGPCLAMMPALESFAEAVEDSVKVCKIDVDNHLDLVQEYKIMGVPTFVLFKGGTPVWKQAGVLSKDQLLNAINDYA